VQLAKAAGASFVAATSSQPSLLLDDGVDLAIDYTNQNWWEHPQFTDERLDVIIDLVGGKEMWRQAKRCKVIKNAQQGGRCVTTTFDNPHMRIASYSQAMGFVLPLPLSASRSQHTRLHKAFLTRRMPSYSTSG
jgi:NADPH:quinone reductase-like Zn-dependent oxidoreductase